MARTTRSRIRPLDLLTAPLRWLEKSRGWRRRLLLFLYLLIVSIVGLLIWVMASLSKLPDIGEAFDVSAFLKETEIPEAEDAFVVYRRARKEASELLDTGSLLILGNPATVLGGWGKLDDKQKAFVERMRPYLEIWRQGTKLRAGSPDQLSTVHYGTKYWEKDLKDSIFLKLAMLEADRLQANGDTEQALEWYLAAARCTGHLRTNGRMNWRWLATFSDEHREKCMIDWAKNPRTTPTQLKHAIEVLSDLDEKTPPISGNLKAEYISLRHSIDDLPRLFGNSLGSEELLPYSDFRFVHHLHWFIKRDPERSRRVLNLMFANWLAHCDDDPMVRPPAVGNAVQSPTWGVYTPTTSTPWAAKVVAADDLLSWLKSTAVLRRVMTMYPYQSPDPHRERAQQNALIVFLAEEAYRREHNGQNAPSTKALVPDYLKKVPVF